MEGLRVLFFFLVLSCVLICVRFFFSICFLLGLEGVVTFESASLWTALAQNMRHVTVFSLSILSFLVPNILLVFFFSYFP